MKLLLGFDIGGTKCAVILGRVSATGEMTIADKIVLSTNTPVMEMIELLYATAERLMDKNKVSVNDIEGIGISCGGPLNSARGVILSPPNLPGWDNIPVVAMTETRFGKKTILQNDANACAVAEWKYGAGKGMPYNQTTEHWEQVQWQNRPASPGWQTVPRGGYIPVMKDGKARRYWGH